MEKVPGPLREGEGLNGHVFPYIMTYQNLKTFLYELVEVDYENGRHGRSKLIGILTEVWPGGVQMNSRRELRLKRIYGVRILSPTESERYYFASKHQGVKAWD